MQRWIVAGLALGAACGCARPQEFSAPAPAGALDCAYREAQRLGYRKLAGEPGERYYRMSQVPEAAAEPGPATGPATGDPGDAARPQPTVFPEPENVRPRPRGARIENQLMLREEGGRLRIQVLAEDRQEQKLSPAADASSHAQMILSACTTPGGA